jgi:hypothetical protein
VIGSYMVSEYMLVKKPRRAQQDRALTHLATSN